MLELIQELMRREWWFELCTGYAGLNSDGELDYHLHTYIGNRDYRIYNDKDAKLFLDEVIRPYCW